MRASHDARALHQANTLASLGSAPDGLDGGLTPSNAPR
jgi:hypothetical protein